jgi:hypothetical protein
LETDTEVLSTGYEPREPQKEIHKAVKDNSWTVCSRTSRMGKTVVQSISSYIQHLNVRRKILSSHILRLLTAKQSVSHGTILLTILDPLGGTANVSELRVDFMGRRISLYGADNPDSIRGIYLDGVVIDEIGDVHPSLFTEVIRPALI